MTATKLTDHNKQLRKELFRQWQYNHSEHCGVWQGMHDNCRWPMPDALLFRSPSNTVFELPLVELGESC